jgi:AcrR family transcriptional regulator
LTLAQKKAILAPMKDDKSLPRRPYHHGDLSSALMDAAEEELKQCGIEGFSLRRVAKRAGVSHAAPAHHFGDVNGLLTALAAKGFERLIQTQRDFRRRAPSNPRKQIEASGVGYVVFALENPALFRLMFGSDRPDFGSVGLQRIAGSAFDELVSLVSAVTNDQGSPKCDGAMMIDVAAAWATAHGLADLLAAGRLNTLGTLPANIRNRRIATIMSRAIA